MTLCSTPARREYDSPARMANSLVKPASSAIVNKPPAIGTIA